MKGLIASLLFGILLVACARPTQVVVVVTATPPAITDTPEPTNTPEPTATPEPSPTPTPEPTPTSTPDTRVIDANPRSVILTKKELPPEGKFFLNNETPNRNSEIISGWGSEQGARYLDESGRVDGWTIEYARGTTTSRVPEWLTINAILYQTADGPLVTLDVLGTPGERNEEWTDIEAPEIGDGSYLSIWRETQPSGKDYLIYELWMRYRNFAVQIWVEGFEGTFDLEWLVQVGESQIQKMAGLELSETVTFTP